MAVKANWQNGEQFNASDANAVADAVNAAYVKPSGGVPITDLTASVQVSLGKADTAVQSVNAASITDSTTTGRAVITAVDAAAARTTLGVSYGSTAGTVVEGNDSRLSPSSTSITDSTATGRSLLTAVDPAAARSAIGVAYGSTGGTVAQGNDSRIVGAEQAANKGVANGYASLDGGGKVPVSQLPSSIMEYQGTFNASTGSPALANGTGNTGDVYRVTVAGTQNFGAGNISFEVGDYVIYNGSVWEKSDTTDAVSTVAGLTGDVTASSLRAAIATGTGSSTNFLRGDGTWSNVQVGAIGASGTPSNTTYLRGDGAWATAGGTRSVQTLTSNATLGSASGTDYVTYADIPYIAATGDPQFSSVQSILTFEGANNSTTITDGATSPVATWSVTNGAKLSTAKSARGTSSLLLAAGDKVTSSASFSPLPNAYGDWTVEFWFNMDKPTYNTFGSPIISGFVEVNFVHFPYYYPGGAEGTISTTKSGRNQINPGTLGYFWGTWVHIAVCRASMVTRFFINGGYSGQTGDNIFMSNEAIVLGSDAFVGNIDDFRFTAAARYSTNSNFTPPTSFPTSYSPEVLPTVTLPSAVSNTNEYRIVNNNSYTLKVNTTSNQTIDGATGGINLAQNEKKLLISNNSGWRTW